MNLVTNPPFTLELEWLRSQAFRWTEWGGWYYGLVAGNLIKVRPSVDGIEFRSQTPEESIKAHVATYFRLDQDIKPIHDALRELDHNMARLVERYGAMRVLRQDPWDTLVAYVCSANRAISGISKNVDKLAGLFPEERSLDGISVKPIPTPQQIAEVGQTELSRLKLGFKYIPRLLSEIAGDVVEGRLDLDALYRAPYAEAKDRLMSYDDIGPKIADCVCLFSLDKAEAFPVDTHITAALAERYGKKYTRGAKNVRLLRWAREYFGAHAGYAGQLLFYDHLLKNS